MRILHVEDDADDRELAAATLRADGLLSEFRYADTRSTFEAELLHHSFDLILADYSLPSFDGLTAQAIARRLAPLTPFIFLSATLGEELAVDRLKDGATDYVLKQRIARLPTAVRRARAEAMERAERQRAEEEVRRLHAELAVRAERSDQLLQAILKHSPLGILVKDVDGRVLLVSPRAAEFLDKPPEDLLGKTTAQVAPPRMADIYAAHDRTVIETKQAKTFEEPYMRGYELGVLEARRFPLLDDSGQVYAICCLSEDVTDRKKSEDDLRLVRLEAERANLAKSEFLSRMSHDLRTPLNAILGFAQLLDLEGLAPDGAEHVRQILSGGRHLLDLVNEVLDITRIETGHLSLSPEVVPVREVIETTAALVRPLAAQRGVTIDVGPLPAEEMAVLADRPRLGQVLINLLSNAVKYNRDNGRVIIRFEPGDATTHQPSRLLVTDTGAGIPPEKVKLLFQPFERLGAERSSIEGTGLGLALSRALARAMGGQLNATSIVDEGSTFWIELPPAVSAPPAAQPAKAAASPAVATTPRAGVVLYVEDNISNVRLMERILCRRPGVELVHAAHAAEVPALVTARRPNVILLDLHLPDVPGDEVLRRLWADPQSRSIPKVMVTADATPGLMKRLKAAGAAAYLTKPLDIAEVLRVIDALLEGNSVAGETP